MKIDNEFVVPAPIERAWDVLTDLPLIAPCMPGATLTDAQDGVYAGKIKIKVGPVIQEFAGTATFLEKDDANHRAVIDAKGKDARGAGNASAVITATLRADGDTTIATVNTDMKISGKLAQFGSGMIKEVSEKLLGAFVACLETKIAGPSPEVEAAQLALADAAGGDAVDESGSLATAVEAPAPTVTAPAPRTAAEPEPAPLDIMALAGGSVAKRAVPVAIAVGVIAVAIIVVAVARR